jgi:hypothetical protein
MKQVEVVLRLNENEVRGTGSWKWCGTWQLPESIVVEGKSCQYMCVAWMNEVVMYGYTKNGFAKMADKFEFPGFVGLSAMQSLVFSFVLWTLGQVLGILC